MKKSKKTSVYFFLKCILIFIAPCFLIALSVEQTSQISKRDKEILQLAQIPLLEKFSSSLALDWSKPQEELFRLGEEALNKEHDVIKAYHIFNYLSLNFKKDQYLFYLGQCYYFMGEMFYEGYIEKYYKKSYEIFTQLRKKNKKNPLYLKWNSFAAAKVGSFIKTKEQGTFSGLSYLRESVSLNDRLLKINSKDEDGLLTEAEYQVETDNIPLFGGSEKKGFQIIEKVLKNNPSNMRANLLMGKFLYSKKNHPIKAIAYLYKAATLYDQKEVAQDMVHYYMRIFLEIHWVRAYSRLKNTEQMFEHLSKHLSMLPRSVSGLGSLVNYLGEIKKDKPAACEVAKRLVQIHPYGKKENLVKKYCVAP